MRLSRRPAFFACLVLSGCGSPTDVRDDFLPDGSYELSLNDPAISDVWNTPGWMFGEPVIRFTKVDSVLTVTSSSNDWVPVGPPRLIQYLERSWNVHFDRTGFPGTHYWGVEFTAARCIKAAAIDVGSTRILNIPIDCEIARQ